MEIVMKSCTRETDGLFHEMANIAFGKQSQDWFRKHCGHIYFSEQDLAFERSLEHNFIAYWNNQPAGTIGVYPIRALVGDLEVSVAGIGTVGVLPEYRSRGVMSWMLRETLAMLDGSDYDVSWLWGERIRYKNYGYELGGKTLKICMNQKSFRALTAIPKQAVSIPGEDHIEQMNSWFCGYTRRVVRDRALWVRHLMRPNLAWRIAEDGSYLVFREESPGRICEAAGTLEGVASILSHHIPEYRLSDLEISAPYEKHILLEGLIQYCSDYTVTSCNQLRVLPKGKTRLLLNEASLRFCADIFSGTKVDFSLYINEIDKV